MRCVGDCDLCGKDESLAEAVVEGALLKVCGNCGRFGNVIPIKKLPQLVKKEISYNEEKTQEVVQDYPVRIRSVRQKFGLTQEDVARKVNEKLSIIQKVESGEIKPPIDLALKLERFFRIKLMEEYNEKTKDKVNFRDTVLTVGDLIKMKDRKI